MGNKNTVKISTTIPQNIVERMDRERGDVTRSKWMVRLLEKAYGLEPSK